MGEDSGLDQGESSGVRAQLSALGCLCRHAGGKELKKRAGKPERDLTHLPSLLKDVRVKSLKTFVN